MTGGYTYAGELQSEIKGGSKIIDLDSIFNSEMQGGEEKKTEEKKSEFNPEKFFQDMKTGGMLGERKQNKEHKKSKIEKYLNPDSDDHDDGFDFSEASKGLDIDENEDTEDIKHKVKVLRAMVSRSKGKKSSKKGKKTSKKSKRMVESSSVGGSDNSISEYLNSTSSISTSDVRLISMNKMKH